MISIINRLRRLEALLIAGGGTHLELTEVTGTSRETLSRDLRVLASLGLAVHSDAPEGGYHELTVYSAKKSTAVFRHNRK